MKKQGRVNVTRGASVVADESSWINWEFPRFREGMIVLRAFAKPLIALLAIVLLVVFRAEIVGAFDHDITTVNIHGEFRHLNPGDIRRVTAPWIGESFLMADLEEIKSRVLALPWVNQVTVQRIWPGKISVHVVEQIPSVFWNEKGFLNQQGEIFTPDVLTVNRDLVAFTGPDNASLEIRQTMMRELENLKSQFALYDAGIQKLALNARGVWEVTLEGGTRVAMGEAPFEEKIDRLGAVLSRANDADRAKMARIDTRYPNGVAVKWREIKLAAHMDTTR